MSLNSNDKTAAFLKKWVYLFSARLSPLIVLLLITVMYSRRLSYEQYGSFQSVWMYTNILNVVITFGFTSLILSTEANYLRDFLKNHKKKIGVFYALLIATTLTLFCEYAKNFQVSTITLVIVFTLVQNISAIGESLMIKNGKEAKLFLINFFYSLGFLLWHLYVLYHQYTLDKLITGATIIGLVKTLFLKYRLPVVADNNTPLINQRQFQKHWIFLGINDITGVLSKWIDKIFLIYLLTSTEFAIFFNGSFEIPLFGLLITIAGNLLMVQVSANNRQPSTVLQAFNSNYKLLSAVVFPIFLFLLFYHEDIFHFLFGRKYDHSIPVFLISIFVLPIRINNYGALLQCFSKGDKIMAGSLIDIVVVIILMCTLYPFFSTRGVALAVVLGTYIQILYYLYHSSRILNVPFSKIFPFRNFITHMAILLPVFFFIHRYVAGNTVWQAMITGSLITILTIIAGLFNFKRNNTIYTDGYHSQI